MNQDNVNYKLEKKFLKFYKSHSDAIFRHCYYRISNEERARELTQDAFMKTWKYLVDGKQIENLRAFTYSVIRNLIIDEYRKKKEYSLNKLQDDIGFQIEQEGFDQNLKNKIDVKLALEYLEKLDEKDREVIIMRYVDDMRVKEIAKIINQTENVISVRIHRSLKKLEKIIKE